MNGKYPGATELGKSAGKKTSKNLSLQSLLYDANDRRLYTGEVSCCSTLKALFSDGIRLILCGNSLFDCL